MRPALLATLVIGLTAAVGVFFAIELASAAAPLRVSLAQEIGKAMKERDDRERARLLESALRGADSTSAASTVLGRLLPRARNAVDAEIGIHALSKMDDPRAVALLGEAALEGSDERRLWAIEALGRSDAPGASSSLLVVAGDENAALRAAAVTALGERHEARQDAALTDALDDDDWRVRSAAIWALTRQGRDDAVPDIAACMRLERGRLVDDCADALSRLTGKRLGIRPDGYVRAWAARTGQDAPERSDWTPPPASLDAPLLLSRSRRILLILSTGESMKDEIRPPELSPAARASLLAAGEDLVDAYDAAATKMDLARVHALAMIRGLQDGTRFDVAVYADSPTFAFGQYVEATSRTRSKAEARIARLSPGGGGNLGDMLVRAFDRKAKDPLLAVEGPDTIVLFSDGRLAAPGTTDRNQVLMAVRRWNRVRQIRFAVVSLRPSDDSVLGPLAAGPPVGPSISLP